MPVRWDFSIILPLSFVALLFLAFPLGVHAEERTVTGRITKLDAAERTFTVTDGMGTGWNYKVAKDADIHLGKFTVGDKVSVTIQRATPLNMMSSADVLKKKDKVVLLEEETPPGRGLRSIR